MHDNRWQAKNLFSVTRGFVRLSYLDYCLCLVKMVRHKNRYIVMSITENDRDSIKQLELKQATLHNAILSMVQQLFGDFGSAAVKAGFTAKYCNKHTKIAIIKVRHGPHKFVTSALPCINSLENKSVVLSILHIGATIRQCFNFLLEYQQKRFDEFSVNFKTKEEKSAMREAIMNIDDVLNIV